MALDLNELMTDLKTAISEIVGRDLTTVRGFQERQLKAIAQQAALVSAGILTGDITPETREFFLDGLEDMVLNFLKTLRGILEITIEKAWNAAIRVIWDAIERATGITLL